MSQSLCAVFTIVDYSKHEEIADVCSLIHVPVSFSTHGHGMADSSDRKSVV